MTNITTEWVPKKLKMGRPSKQPGLLTYDGYHKQVKRLRGKPSICAHCKTTTAGKYEWANLTKNYADPNDYIRLCTSCHRKMDDQGRHNFLLRKPKNCLSCGKIFQPNAGNNVRCGNRYKEGSCARKHFNEYHRLRMKAIYESKSLIV